jgi:hypothetical protein
MAVPRRAPVSAGLFGGLDVLLPSFCAQPREGLQTLGACATFQLDVFDSANKSKDKMDTKRKKSY